MANKGYKGGYFRNKKQTTSYKLRQNKIISPLGKQKNGDIAPKQP
jgi:hypothetical protein